jgi:hypothetical protein
VPADKLKTVNPDKPRRPPSPPRRKNRFNERVRAPEPATMSARSCAGAKPADIPVGQPAKYDLVINLTAGKALELTIPDHFCCADELID